jgi:tRNA threonylcarbamoyl adenosine modification protein YeaZ
VILAFDTSTELTSVAVCDGTDAIERWEIDARRHAEVLAPLMRDVLAAADANAQQITAVACGVGPGAYTGLRVGIATARAVGLAWDRPVVGLCSLDAMAAAVFSDPEIDDVCVASDARRHEVYWASYSRSVGRVTGPLVQRPSDIDPAVRLRRWAGHGAETYADQFGDVVTGIADARYPHAAWIGRLAGELISTGVSAVDHGIDLVGHGGDGATTASALGGARLLTPEPLYLRRPDATEPVKAAR